MRIAELSAEITYKKFGSGNYITEPEIKAINYDLIL